MPQPEGDRLQPGPQGQRPWPASAALRQCEHHQRRQHRRQQYMVGDARGEQRGTQRAKGRYEQQQGRSEEHTSELQSLMRISYAVFCLKQKKKTHTIHHTVKQTTITVKNTTNSNTTQERN